MQLWKTRLEKMFQTRLGKPIKVGAEGKQKININIYRKFFTLLHVEFIEASS